MMLEDEADRGAKESSPVLLEARGVKVHFPMRSGSLWNRQRNVVRAVDGIDLQVKRGETLGLVGESGCGKSTTGRALLQLIRPTAGDVVFEGQSLISLWHRRYGNWRWKEQLRALRCRMQMIFQDPYGSLNPRMTVEQIVGEPLRTFGFASGTELRHRVQDLMVKVGLDPRYIRRYPHEFSGGQRQRIGIARALALGPSLIVADEPISALDVSIQAQILNLLGDLQRQMNLTYVFIAHDLAAVRHISDRIAVMYLGRVVEVASYSKLYQKPLHPYTKALISAVPIPDPRVERTRSRTVLKGDVPSPLNPPTGCAFHPRCPEATEECSMRTPEMRQITPDHQVACHLVQLPTRRV